MSKAKAAAKRRVLRVQVSFWTLGQPEESRVGFTTDVSATGVFIATNSPLPTKTEIVIMIDDDPEAPFVLLGEVVRAVKVPLALQRVKKSGMGVQFDNQEDQAVKQLNQMGQPISGTLTY
jgi:hypothetical protein